MRNLFAIIIFSFALFISCSKKEEQPMQQEKQPTMTEDQKFAPAEKIHQLLAGKIALKIFYGIILQQRGGFQAHIANNLSPVILCFKGLQPEKIYHRLTVIPFPGKSRQA